MEKFEIQAEETIEIRRNNYVKETVEELRRKEDTYDKLINLLEDQLQNQNLRTSHQNSAYETIEYRRQRLRNQDPFLSQDFSASTKNVSNEEATWRVF